MRHLAHCIALIIATALLALGNINAAKSGMGGGGGFPGPGAAVPAMIPALVPPERSAFCATPVRSCLLHQPGHVGDPCLCRVRGGRSEGQIIAPPQ